MDNETFELLQKIKIRPEIFLGTQSIVRLSDFLGGYEYARYLKEGDAFYQSSFQKVFNDWTAHRFGVVDTLNWCSIILNRSTDEAAALELFFILLDEFVAN